jgi:phenylalanyl-tRNA synthetase beta chain
MHAFNLAKITGESSGIIHVRYANSGEKLQLLNGENLALQYDMLVIADEVNPLALAGIMGGSESRVEQGATDLFLESAFFSPRVISGKSLQLGINSDSAHRFERGVDFATTRSVMERATSLILDICGGHAGPITEVKGKLPQRNPILLREKRVQRILGINLNKNKMTELLQRLQFDFSIKNEIFHVIPPTYRFDLVIEEDLIEEIARIYGYNHIPANLPRVSLNILPEPETVRTTAQLRRIFVARDYQEVINYAFVDAEWEENLANNTTPVMLKNPISSQMDAMRSSLAGGLISNLQFNLNRKQTRVRLFEIGSCFMREDGAYAQSEKLAGLCYGDVVAEQWDLPERKVDFYDAKADIEALFWPEIISFEGTSHPAIHPGKSAQIRLGEKIAGWLGELHPRWQQKADLPKSVVLFELDLDSLMRRTLPTVGEIPKYPSVRRDIAVIVADGINAQSLLESMRALNSPIISEIALFDVYRGEGMTRGKKSLAFRVLLQDTKKTLTDAEADFVITKLIKILENKFEAKLRN